MLKKIKTANLVCSYNRNFLDLVNILTEDLGMYRKIIKPFIDFSVAVILLIFAAPFFLIIGTFIKFTSKGPVFFKQERLGENEKPFILNKFRTMTDEKREVGNIPIVGRAEGVTKIGYFLRRYKIDELPQLICVLKGEMSLVGPRPNVKSKLISMSNQERKRYQVKPGLTGLAQVSGNIYLPWSERFKLDLIYIENLSLRTDIKILLRTFLLIFKGEEKFKNKELIGINEIFTSTKNSNCRIG